MPKRLKVYIIVVSVMLFAGYLVIRRPRRTGLDSVQALVLQNVRAGAGLQDVLHFLDVNQLEHSGLRHLTDRESLYQTYKDSPVVLAIRRHTDRDLFCDEDAQVAFVFDEDNRLVRYDVKPIYTCP